MKFRNVVQIDRHMYLCHECLDGGDPEPIKGKSTPHCLACGSHHPIHQNCDGSVVQMLDIPYMQLFYTSKQTNVNEIGIV